MEYVVREINSGQIFAESRTVQVAYDYNQGRTIPVHDDWRKRISEFEGLD
jgi:acyl-CoA thioesterase FadM